MMTDFSGDGDLPAGVKYNDGWLQILRINEIKRLVNFAKLNPKSFNAQYGMWNFELWFNNLTVMLDEVWFKLKEEERNDINKIKDLIQKYINDGQVIQSKKQATFPYRDISVINQNNWSELLKLLSIYDHEVRDFMNSKGFGNPDIDNEEDLLYG